MDVLAHISHWYHAVLYILPVIVVLIAIGVSAWRARGLEDEPPPASEAPETDDFYSRS